MANPVHNLFGVLSESETAVIRHGLGSVLRDHLVDVVDSEAGPELVLRSGARHQVAPGSWIVNCTGYITPRDEPFESYVSATGAVLSVNRTTMTLGFSTFTAYFLTHLMFLGKLTEAPLLSFDLSELQRRAPAAFPPVMQAMLQHNLSVVFDAVPSKVFQQCGLDFDLWYPLPRRLAGQVQFMLTHRKRREHHRRSLEIASERFGIRCGPVVPVG